MLQGREAKVPAAAGAWVPAARVYGEGEAAVGALAPVQVSAAASGGAMVLGVSAPSVQGRSLPALPQMTRRPLELRQPL